MPHVWDMVSRLSEPVIGTVGGDTMWQTVLDAGLFTLKIAAFGWIIGVVVGLRPGARHAALHDRGGGGPAVDRAEPDRAAHRDRPARTPVGLADHDRRVRVAERALGRGHRGLPRVLPGRRRRAARAQGARRHSCRPHAHVRHRLVAHAVQPAAAGQRAVPHPCAAARRRLGRHRHGRRGGVDRPARRRGPPDHRVRPVGQQRPGQALGADLRRDRGRPRRRRASSACSASPSSPIDVRRSRREPPSSRRSVASAVRSAVARARPSRRSSRST